MGYIAIRKWDEFQHYTDRRPPWVKLHVQTLDNAELAALDQGSQLVFYKLLMIASKSDNRTTDNVRILAGWMQMTTRTVNAGLKKLESCGLLDFRYETEHEIRMAQNGQIPLIPASAVQAPRKQNASPRARPRTRGETETETEDPPSSGFSTKDPHAPATEPTALRPNMNGLTTLEKLIAEAGGDHGSEGVIRAAANGKPEHVIATARESLAARKKRQPPLQNAAGYVVAAIRKIAAEHTPTPTPEPDF